MSRFFVLIFGCSRFYPEIETHHFCEREKKAGFTGEFIALLLTRMFLSAPLFSEVTRIMFGTEKRRRLPCGVANPCRGFVAAGAKPTPHLAAV